MAVGPDEFIFAGIGLVVTFEPTRQAHRSSVSFQLKRGNM